MIFDVKIVGKSDLAAHVRVMNPSSFNSVDMWLPLSHCPMVGVFPVGSRVRAMIPDWLVKKAGIEAFQVEGPVTPSPVTPNLWPTASGPDAVWDILQGLLATKPVSLAPDPDVPLDFLLDG